MTWQQSVFQILLVGLVFRSILALWLFPGYDEGYYYLYSQHLDWSYFDHPPLVALTTGFGVWLTGIASPFTLRLGTLILYTGSLLLLYLTSARLFNHQGAKITLIIASIIPIFTVGFGVITLPDSPLIFFWSASLYCAVCEFFPTANQSYRPSYRLSILGILVGLACLSKYHGFILALGLIAFCLTSSKHRCALFSPWMGLAIGLFIITLFPLWFWNLQHNWVSLRFQLFHRFDPPPEGIVSPSGYNLLKVFGVFLTGIGLLFPTIGFPLWWVNLRTLINQFSDIFPHKWLQYSWVFPLRERDDFLKEKQLLILWVSLPLMVGFTLLGGKQQILVTWPIPGFWGATLLLGIYAFQWQQRSRYLIRWWLGGTGIIISTILFLLLLHITTGTLQKSSHSAIFGGFLEPKSDPANELIDIQQLRQGFASSPVLLNALQNSHFIFSNAYYLGGLIDLALRPLNPIPVTCFSYDRRGFSFWPDTDQWIGEDALYITLERFHKMPHLNNEFRDYFLSFQEIGTVPIQRGGVVVTIFHVYQAKTLLRPYSSPINNQLN
ncbi:putative glycosyl transferase [Rippkaea orientalis PCC 8801]|uniref:Putative glycosyl transferase n=1 Tax=Rippkaea orientalis (strain PCC 8801 / RF-1) TaxID=41431 RepID=B7K577_RIPO1|nr:glycosyltransferase family 39 protein [Rippkaea orientalis]ACK67903.1 putative glycosyl transferase [Rippkaea orientalis PCC 8801]